MTVREACVMIESTLGPGLFYELGMHFRMQPTGRSEVEFYCIIRERGKMHTAPYLIDAVSKAIAAEGIGRADQCISSAQTERPITIQSNRRPVHVNR